MFVYKCSINGFFFFYSPRLHAFKEHFIRMGSFTNSLMPAFIFFSVRLLLCCLCFKCSAWCIMVLLSWMIFFFFFHSMKWGDSTWLKPISESSVSDSHFTSLFSICFVVLDIHFRICVHGMAKTWLFFENCDKSCIESM